MSSTADALLLTVCLVATSVWIGGYVAIGVVARAASSVLDAEQRVRFFRALGRSYLGVGLGALVVALVSGGLLARNQHWGALLISAVVVSAALLLLLGVAVVQARRMTRLRGRLVRAPDDVHLAARVRREAVGATTLRALLGLLSLAVLVIGAFLAT